MKRSKAPPVLRGSAFVVAVLLSTASVHSQERSTVSKVVDHCTIVVGRGEKVALIGVDKPPTDAFTARDARDHLADILQGRQVVLVADPLVADARGVRARYVYLDGDLVNARVISEGFAGVRRDQDFGKADAFIQAEKVARRMKIGAWVLDARVTDQQFGLSISPNPVSDVAMLQYQVPVRSNVSLLVIDSNDRVVASLVNSRMEKGGYSAVFQRLRLPDGTYRVQLSAGARVTSEIMVLTGMARRDIDEGLSVADPDEISLEEAEEAPPPAARPVERRNFMLPGGMQAAVRQ